MANSEHIPESQQRGYVARRLKAELRLSFASALESSVGGPFCIVRAFFACMAECGDADCDVERIAMRWRSVHRRNYMSFFHGLRADECGGKSSMSRRHTRARRYQDRKIAPSQMEVVGCTKRGDGGRREWELLAGDEGGGEGGQSEETRVNCKGRWHAGQ